MLLTVSIWTVMEGANQQIRIDLCRIGDLERLQVVNQLVAFVRFVF